jgi:2-aminoadipate transaminase
MLVLTMWDRPQLDPNSGTPLYRQLYDHFRRAIEIGNLKSGQKLPATRELAGMLGLNRTTVSAAYEILETEGFIAGHVGRGSFVTGTAAPAAKDWGALLRPNRVLETRSGEPVEISFAASRPSSGLFPLEALEQSCREALARGGVSILQLGSPGGYEPLRRYLADEARREGVLSEGDDLIVTNGCQQALDLFSRSLLSPGDHVVVEDPVYPGVKNLFTEADLRLTGLPVGESGIDLDLLEAAIEREKPRAVVVTSNFQNPTGRTMGLDARARLVRLARRSGAVLIENDIYGGLRYRGEAALAIKSIDEAGGTVLLRSFSKIAFPGLRVGWAIGPRPLIGRMKQAKQLTDLHTDQLSQAVLLRFAESGRLEDHRRRVLEAGAERLRAVLDACRAYLPPGTRFTEPEGGMNLWVSLPDPLDAGELLPRAEREGVSYLPGKYFAVSRPEPGGLRLSFAGLEPEKIERGVRILGGIFSAELERVRAARSLEPEPAMV